MLRKFAFRGPDVASDIRDKYGFDGELLDIFAGNTGPIVHKWHHYIPIYDRYFSPFRASNIRFLEIGVSKGGSLRLWRQYFGADATIFGIDIDPECAAFDGKSGRVRIGSQDDPAFLQDVVAEMGGVDVVLDDGSHVMDHIRMSFATLFPALSVGGVYMIEDLHAAYWHEFGGGRDAPGNFFNDMRRMIDEMHEWYHDGGPPSATGATGLHVHDSIAVVEKGQVLPPVHSRIGGAV